MTTDEKNPGGRPRLSTEPDNPTVRVALRMTTAQRLTLQRVADHQGLRISEVVRTVIDRFDRPRR